jgi:hypothetical protein
VEREVIVVDNALPSGVVEESPGRLLMGGDDHSREFSGIDRAVAHIGARIWSFDLVQMGTCAFQELYTGYLDRFSVPMLGLIRDRPVCLGHIDCYNAPVEILGYRSRHWIRTSLFFLPPAEVMALKTFVSISDVGLFSGDPASPFLADAPIDERYRQYLIDWCVGRDIGQGVVWHSPMALTRDTLPAFESKARAVMNEHLLAIRLRALGCVTADVTWLATCLENQAGVAVLWETPPAEQLAMRSWDPIPLT